MLNRLGLILATVTSVLAVGGDVCGQGVVTQWNFPPGFNTNAPAPSTGSGTASLIGGVTATSSGGLGDGGSTEATALSVAWNTATYPAQSISSGTAGTLYKVGTPSSSNIVFRHDVRHTNTSSRFARVEYTLDGLTFTAGATFSANVGGSVWYNNRTVDLSGINGANNNANFGVRIVTVFDPANSSYTASAPGSTYETTGALRFDAVTMTSGHVFTGVGDTSLGNGDNFGGGTPSPTSTVLLGSAAGANTTVTTASGGTTLAQLVTQSGAPAFTIGGADSLTLTSGLVHGATNILTIDAPVVFGQSNAIQNSGTVNLNGAMAFTNYLTLQGGRTNINGLATGTLSSITSNNPSQATIRVAPGSTLGGTGTINRIVSVTALSATNSGVITAGTLADPSLNIGTTATAFNLLIGSNAAYDVKLFGTNASDISLINVIGNVTIDSTARITLDLSGVSRDALLSAAPNGRTYTVLVGTGATVNNFNTANLFYSNLNGFVASDFTIIAAPSAGKVQIQFTPVPEPGTVFAFGAAGLGLLGAFRRFRNPKT